MLGRSEGSQQPADERHFHAPALRTFGVRGRFPQQRRHRVPQVDERTHIAFRGCEGQSLSQEPQGFVAGGGCQRLQRRAYRRALQ